MLNGHKVILVTPCYAPAHIFTASREMLECMWTDGATPSGSGSTSTAASTATSLTTWRHRMSESRGRGGDWPIPNAPEPPTLESRAVRYRAALANPDDWREVVNARGALLGCVTADAVLALVERSDDLDRLLAIVAHGDPFEIATADACIGGCS